MLSGVQIPEKGYQEGGLYTVSKQISIDIQNNLPKGSSIAINHAGFLPYFLPEYNCIDMTGLNDVHIAHNAKGGLHQKFDVEYVLEAQPDLIVINRRTHPAKGGIPSYWVGESALFHHARFLQNYIPMGFYERKSFGGEKAYIVLYTRITQ